MANKPPAFQFYVKDWRSSPAVQRMTHKQRGIYIDLLALAWDSEEPGTITMTIPQICRELRVFSATLRRLLADFPTTLQKVGNKFVQPRLHKEWVKYHEISEKRKQAASKCSASAKQKHSSAFAFASASALKATATATPNPATNVEETKRQIQLRAEAIRSGKENFNGRYKTAAERATDTTIAAVAKLVGMPRQVDVDIQPSLPAGDERNNNLGLPRNTERSNGC